MQAVLCQKMNVTIIQELLAFGGRQDNTKTKYAIKKSQRTDNNQQRNLFNHSQLTIESLKKVILCACSRVQLNVLVRNLLYQEL